MRICDDVPDLDANGERRAVAINYCAAASNDSNRAKPGNLFTLEVMAVAINLEINETTGKAKVCQTKHHDSQTNSRMQLVTTLFGWRYSASRCYSHVASHFLTVSKLLGACNLTATHALILHDVDERICACLRHIKLLRQRADSMIALQRSNLFD